MHPSEIAVRHKEYKIMATRRLSHTDKLFHTLPALLAVAAITLTLAISVKAQTETVIYDMGTKAPDLPWSGLVFDTAGNLYGVANGVVYTLAPVSGGWQESVIYTFSGGTDGGDPLFTPIFDGAGNLYGTTSTGGSLGCGVVYKLSPTSGGVWKETVLYSFAGGKDGCNPGLGNLVSDAAGNLYGSNAAGGNVTTQSCQNTSGCGVIFELSPTAEGKWKFNLLHTFSGGNDGVGPASLSFDSAGTLYGAAGGAWGGFTAPSGPGLVFKLTPSSGGAWKESVVHAFTGRADGAYPSRLIFDTAGNIYGTGAAGGRVNDCSSAGYNIGCGVVFELSPTSSGHWKESVLYGFSGRADGSAPEAGLVLDAAGNLYGTTWGGGAQTCPFGCGTIFKVTPQSGGGWKQTTVHTFQGSDGQAPRSQLIPGSSGKFYGTTEQGGTAGGDGTVFEFIP